VRVLDGARLRWPEPMVAEIGDQVEAGRSVMVLATCSYVLTTTMARLRAEGIPFHNPYRRKRGDWNPLRLGSARVTTATDRLLAFLRPDPDTWGDDARWYQGRDLRSWLDPMSTKDFLRRGAKTDADALDPVTAVDPDFFDGLFVNEDVLVRAVQAVSDHDLDWFAAHLLASKARPFEFPLTVVRRRDSASLRRTPSVVIGTIHSVKGGEADVVYLFPDLSRAGARQWWGAVDGHDEIVRQMYVGMTRAREELVVCGHSSDASVDPRAMVRGAA